MFSKILIANRGEIALRILRACRELGIKTVAIFSEADKEALHTRYADEAHLIGPPEPKQSYLNIQKIIEVAVNSGSEAIHPGYGFLAQIPSFVQQCELNNISFIGPSSQTLELMSNKTMARVTIEKAGIPIIPGSTSASTNNDEVKQTAESIGYPILIKAVFGGGGKGLRVVKNPDEVDQAIELAQLEAEASFGRKQLYVEKFLEKPRHIEFQILADKESNFIHLGERECSIQRKHQKIIEETPSPTMTKEKRAEIGEVAKQAAKASNYVNVGTVEFLVDKDGNFYFLEMNTRLQVEHLVTEMVTGIDIVKEQIRIAAGEKLSYKQSEVTINGHALNCRINAEDPSKDFAPSPGVITDLRLPGGPGVRVDTGLYVGCQIPLVYDSLIAKIATWGHHRDEALQRMRNALRELSIEGVETSTPFLIEILRDEAYQSGRIHTRFVEERMTKQTSESVNSREDVAILSAVLAKYLNRKESKATIPSRSRNHFSLWKASGRREYHSQGGLKWIH